METDSECDLSVDRPVPSTKTSSSADEYTLKPPTKIKIISPKAASQLSAKPTTSFQTKTLSTKVLPNKTVSIPNIPEKKVPISDIPKKTAPVSNIPKKTVASTEPCLRQGEHLVTYKDGKYHFKSTALSKRLAGREDSQSNNSTDTGPDSQEDQQYVTV